MINLLTQWETEEENQKTGDNVPPIDREHNGDMLLIDRKHNGDVLLLDGKYNGDMLLINRELPHIRR